MGRTKKFSFPLPGRKPGYAKSKRSSEESRLNGASLSKAQRFFGTESDLNIDSPTRDDDGTWHSKELGPMSIALSETTEDWDDLDDDDSDILPARVLYGKASSTLLGLDYRGSVESRTSRDLQSDRSSSTLKSYYDRQKTPLAVSQQTSASSVRDQALRKGQPVVTSPRSPLMSTDFPGVRDSKPVEKTKKKPSRLDLTRLMPKSRRDTGDELLMLSPDTYNPRQPTSRSPSLLRPVESPHTPTKPANRKLDFNRISRPISASATTHIAQLMIEPTIPARTRHSEPRQQTNSDVSGRWSDSQSMAERTTPARTRRSESRQQINSDVSGKWSDSQSMTEPTIPARTRLSESRQQINSDISGKWSDSQSMTEPTIPARTRLSEPRQQINSDVSGKWSDSQHWDNTSTASKSSLNTKSSKRSVVSASDLRTTSVLSLSSDEDTEEEVKSPPREPTRPAPKPRRILSQIDEHPHDFLAIPAQEGCIIAIPAQDGNFLTIPLPIPGSSRLSGPWAQPSGDVGHRTSEPNTRFQRPEMQEPTPPLSPPSSVELLDGSDQNSRLMAVTKQEEALLEALRQKRARMREKIIAEHEKIIAEHEKVAEHEKIAEHERVEHERVAGHERVEYERVAEYEGVEHERVAEHERVEHEKVIAERETKSSSRYDPDIALRAVMTLGAPFKERSRETEPRETLGRETIGRETLEPSREILGPLKEIPRSNETLGPSKETPRPSKETPVRLFKDATVRTFKEQTIRGPIKELSLLGPIKEQSPTKGKERILLYLDRPIAESSPIDTAEPSPDLSDFISFGSDSEDEFGPPSSWIQSKDLPRPDSMASPTNGSRTPLSTHSAVRLSAVGAGSFPPARRQRKSDRSFMSSSWNANGSREVLNE